MPILSQQQRAALDRHIKANTIYNWDSTAADYNARTYIVDCMQRMLDSRVDLTRESSPLLMPNSFINQRNSSFWFRMAAVVCGDEGVSSWHETVLGHSLFDRESTNQRYIYTWTLRGEQYQFYTRLLVYNNLRKELVWFMRKSTYNNEFQSECSGNDTEPEDIMVGQST
jgi:hypothetical protein